MTRIHRKRIALIAAAALLFSALSPAIASVLFSHRSDMLAGVLGVAAHHGAVAGDAAHDDGCPHETVAAENGASTGAGAPSDEPNDHAAHGIFCSFCLASAATVSLTGGAPAGVATVAQADVIVPAPHTQPVVARLPSTHRSRAPPTLS